MDISWLFPVGEIIIESSRDNRGFEFNYLHGILIFLVLMSAAAFGIDALARRKKRKDAALHAQEQEEQRATQRKHAVLIAEYFDDNDEYVNAETYEERKDLAETAWRRIKLPRDFEYTPEHDLAVAEHYAIQARDDSDLQKFSITDLQRDFVQYMSHKLCADTIVEGMESEERYDYSRMSSGMREKIVASSVQNVADDVHDVAYHIPLVQYFVNERVQQDSYVRMKQRQAQQQQRARNDSGDNTAALMTMHTAMNIGR